MSKNMKGPQRSQAERQSSAVIQSGFLHMAESFSFLCRILNATQARVSDQPNKLKVYVHTINMNVRILYFLYIIYRLQFSWLRTNIYQYLAISSRPAVQRSWNDCCDLAFNLPKVQSTAFEEQTVSQICH